MNTVFMVHAECLVHSGDSYVILKHTEHTMCQAPCFATIIYFNLYTNLMREISVSLQLGKLSHREILRNGKADRKGEVESGGQKEHKPSGIILIHSRKIYIQEHTLY